MTRVAFACCACLALGSCVDHRAAITGTQSLQVTLTAPTDPGSITNRLPDTARTVSFQITALGPDGQPDTSYAQPLQVYVHFLGTLTPYLGMPPLATVSMTQGKGTLSMTLPPVFGPTNVWFDDGTDSDPSYATGVSPTLWYRDPTIADIQTPASESSPDALSVAPLDNKNVDVSISRYGARGRLVITSVYSQGYTVADVQCADANGTPPCVANNYDYLDIFSYSAPLDQAHRFLSEGQVIDRFAGGVSEFDALTEVGFPQTFVNSDTPDINMAREPQAVKLDATGGANDWFINTINFERNESALIEIDNAKVCNLDSSYDTYKEWKIDPAGAGGDCSGNPRVIQLVSAGVSDIDPATLVGKTLPRVLGILRPISTYWIIYPRSSADLM
jgi:hypothetical protein